MSRDDIVQAGSGGPDFTPKDWPIPERPELPDADPALFTDPLFGDFTPAPERPDHMTTEQMLRRAAELQASADYGVGYTVKERNEFLRIANGLDFGRLQVAAPVTDAGLRAEELDEGRLGLALHRIYCQQNAPMHSEPHHSAKRIAAEYAALSRQAEKETA